MKVDDNVITGGFLVKNVIVDPRFIVNGAYVTFDQVSSHFAGLFLSSFGSDSNDDEMVGFPSSSGGGTGPQGAPGATGAQGVPGYSGSDGDDGDIGIPGLQGIQGLQGVQGPIGNDGYDGDDGLTVVGMPGLNGVDGVSADDNELEWLKIRVDRLSRAMSMFGFDIEHDSFLSNK